MNRLVLTAALLLAGCTAKPAMTVQQLMKDKVQPTADIYWKSVQYISDDKGNHDIVPHSDADWERVRQAAADLQAYGKLLQTAAYSKGRNPDWIRISQDMVTISAQAEQAAREKNPDKVFAVSGTMYDVCSGCHTVYPATVGPEANGSAKS